MTSILSEAFFQRALLAGLAVALVSGPVGCFIVWRRMAYFGESLAHSGLLGVGLGLLFSFNITLENRLASKKAQNHATKNMTSEAMNMIMP